jgi:hypothetical protein
VLPIRSALSSHGSSTLFRNTENKVTRSVGCRSLRVRGIPSVNVGSYDGCTSSGGVALFATLSICRSNTAAGRGSGVRGLYSCAWQGLGVQRRGDENGASQLEAAARFPSALAVARGGARLLVQSPGVVEGLLSPAEFASPSVSLLVRMARKRTLVDND